MYKKVMFKFYDSKVMRSYCKKGEGKKGDLIFQVGDKEKRGDTDFLLI